jgi:hypothetical protein
MATRKTKGEEPKEPPGKLKRQLMEQLRIELA